MTKDKGPRVIITAGASGIGLAIARRFASRGARVSICDIDESAIKKVSGEFTLAQDCDVTDARTMGGFVDRAVEAMDGLDTLIANAGSAGPTAYLEDIDPADWERTVAVNLTGQFCLLRAAIPYLKRQEQGTIILMSSAAGRLGLPMRSPYAAAKWGVIGLKETLAMELGPYGVSVNAILPGAVEGERIDKVLNAKANAAGITLADARRAEVENVSMKRMIVPDEIADLAWFLAAPSAQSISGQSIGICGNFETLR